MPAPLIISFDDLTATVLDDARVHAPNLRRLMGESTVFANAFAQVAICGASRASMLSGLYPAQTKVFANDADIFETVRPADTLPAIIRQAGHAVGIYGKVFHGGPFDPATNAILASEFIVDKSYWSLNGYQGVIPDSAAHGDTVNADAAIAAMSADAEAVVFWGPYRPHSDRFQQQRFWDLYEGPIAAEYGQERVARWMHQFRADLPVGIPELEDFVRGYFAAVSATDEELGRVLAVADAQGRAVVAFSDHGYHLGEYNELHKFTLWEQALRAPLMIRVPGGAPAVIDEVVELIDIPTTILSLMGITVPAHFRGQDLMAYVADPTHRGKDCAISWMYGSVSLRDGSYRLTRYQNGEFDFYRYGSQIDISSTAQCAADLRRMNVALRAKMSATGFGEEDGFVIARGNVRGGAEDNTYFVHRPVTITDAGGHDRVYTTIHLKLPEGLEDMIADQRLSATLELTGNEGNNRIWGGLRIFGMGGDDNITSGRTETVDGGAGDDTIDLTGNAPAVSGGDGNDTITTWTGQDTIDGGAGNDSINARGGDDSISGGDGDDVLRGGGGDDTIDAGDGNDAVFGGPGADQITLRSGDDTCELNGDDTVLIAGTGMKEFRLVQGGAVEISGFSTGRFRGFSGQSQSVVAGDTVITHPTGTVTLVGYTGPIDFI